MLERRLPPPSVFMVKSVMRLLARLAIALVYPACDGKHKDGRNDRSHDNRPKLRLYNVKVEHDGHSWRDEEETDVANKKFGNAAHPFKADDLELQQKRKEKHTKNARR